MRKKLLSLFLAVTMVASVCACGKTEPASSDEPETKQSEVVSSDTVAQSSEAVEEEKPLYPLVDEPITVTGVVINKQEF